MDNRRKLAFARVYCNLLLGGSATAALIALFRIGMRDRQDRER
jgi:hypothetical protein